MSHAPDPSAKAPQRLNGRFSGLSYEAEPCPECRTSDQLKGGVGGGLIGYGLTFLLGASPFGRLLGAAAGATIGALASKWHLRVDWDPEALRGGLLGRPAASQGPEV